ncbi:MAG TPA: SAM-dependent methyltransferase [Frateuria sp.]|uniref:SAM-dependent methyltransferase n=1 Tax=Frateuria sp. TaxID=2211372 RepID=UPI002D7E21B5|nr:SAM-dependent methyltransferase [Frateuria sp.]HET6805658.1 SAM-dependent methyltransferase [Frateuria sp.]
MDGSLNVLPASAGAEKKILDPCCGSRMFWFDRNNPAVVYGDIRQEQHTLCDGRSLSIFPDVPLDFRRLPYADAAFKLVVFDPPHLRKAGEESWMRAKYGALNPLTWRDDLRAGFAECFRVLADDGVLIFKWNETQIRVSEVLALTEQRPLFGHPSGKKGGTHWMCFMKGVGGAA